MAKLRLVNHEMMKPVFLGHVIRDPSHNVDHCFLDSTDLLGICFGGFPKHPKLEIPKSTEAKIMLLGAGVE
jgi:hypothetical protein